MTNNTQFKTLVNTWLNQKKPMITPSTHASFTLIAENHLIPYFGKRKIGSITEADIQNYISYLYNAGRLDKSGGLTVKTIRDVILVLRLAMEFAYKERAIPLLNWDLVEYPKELGVKKVVLCKNCLNIFPTIPLNAWMQSLLASAGRSYRAG